MDRCARLLMLCIFARILSEYLQASTCMYVLYIHVNNREISRYICITWILNEYIWWFLIMLIENKTKQFHWCSWANDWKAWSIYWLINGLKKLGNGMSTSTTDNPSVLADTPCSTYWHTTQWSAADTSMIHNQTLQRAARWICLCKLPYVNPTENRKTVHGNRSNRFRAFLCRKRKS